MPTITIDNIHYDVDTLSAEAKAQLQRLQFVDAELRDGSVSRYSVLVPITGPSAG